MIEILTFALGAGIDAQQLLDTDARVQTEFAYHQAGLLRRTTGHNDDGRWLVLQVWASESAADAARQAFDESALGAEFAALTDPDSVHLERFAGID
jgi:hypothetical protein